MNPINFLGLTSGDRSLPPLLMLADLPQRWQPRALAMKTLPGSLIFSWRGDPAAQPLLCDAGGTGDQVVLAGTQWHDLLHLHRSQLRLPVPAGAFACWGGGGGLLDPGAAEPAGMGLTVRSEVWKVSVPHGSFECCCVSFSLVTAGLQRGWLGAL